MKCSKCGTDVTPEGVIVADEGERCEVQSPTQKLRCQRKKYHPSNHYHYPFVWVQGNILGATVWEKGEKLL